MAALPTGHVIIATTYIKSAMLYLNIHHCYMMITDKGLSGCCATRYAKGDFFERGVVAGGWGYTP